MRRLLLLMALCGLSNLALAYTKDTVKPRLANGRVNELANGFSERSKSDSEIVAYIFDWVAHNIAWDAKAFNKEEKLHTKTSREVLRSKTAKPREYAQLMKDLCEAAGIKTVVITGYEKNELYEDGAGFYMPNHAWNAVWIQNRWLLLDACDAAGSHNMELSWWKKQLQKMNKKKLYTSTKVKFEFDYKPEYLFQDPLEVRLTRVPLDPLWQLCDSVLPISVFEKTDDEVRAFNTRYPGLKTHSLKLAEISSLDDNAYIIECAERTYAYNPRYTEMKARKHIALANEQVDKINEITDKEKKGKEIAACKQNLEQAKNILIDQKQDISREYSELRKVNMEKKLDVNKYRQAFSQANQKHISALSSRISSAGNKQSALKSEAETKSKKLNDINPTSYTNARQTGPTRKSGDKEVQVLRDSMSRRDRLIAVSKQDNGDKRDELEKLKSQYDEIMDSLVVYLKLADSTFYKEALARSKKQDSFDDSMKVLRSKLYHYKVQKVDALQNQSIQIYDQIVKTYEHIKKNCAQINDAARKNIKDVEALKRLNTAFDLDADYNSNRNEFTSSIRDFVNNNLSALHFFANTNPRLSAIKKVYVNQNKYFDYLGNNEDERKEYVKKMLDKAESIDKKHNEQKKDLVIKAKEELSEARKNKTSRKKKNREDNS